MFVLAFNMQPSVKLRDGLSSSNYSRGFTMRKILIVLCATFLPLAMATTYSQAFSTGDIVNHTDESRVHALWRNQMADYSRHHPYTRNVGACYTCAIAGRMKYAFSVGHGDEQSAKNDAATRFDTLAGKCPGLDSIRQEVQSCDARGEFHKLY